MIAKITVPSGVGISVHVDGVEDNPWLVLSNSIAATHRMWDPQMQALTQKYRVLRYDTRGHGDSDAPNAPYQFCDLVDDVVGLMDDFEMESPIFMGLSLGGMTGLGVAITHPDRLRSIVCCDARADAPRPFVQGWDDRIKAVRENGFGAMIPGTIERWLSAPFRAANPTIVSDIESMISSTSLSGFEGCAEALKRLDYLPSLHRIKIPTLFVVGSEDRGAPPPVMRSMAERVTGSLFEVVEGSCHLPNIDNPIGFEHAISDFLRLGRS